MAALHAAALALLLVPAAAPVSDVTAMPALHVFDVVAAPAAAPAPAVPPATPPPRLPRPAAPPVVAVVAVAPAAALAPALAVLPAAVAAAPAGDNGAAASAALPVAASARDAYARQLWLHIAAHQTGGARLAGTALVSFTLDDQGALTALALAQSSGNAMLDRIALRSVRRAAPMPPPPAELGAALNFTLPVRFG